MRLRRVMACALALMIAAGICGGPTPVVAAQAAERCFPETGKCVRGEFYAYWLANGGLTQQGMPISDEFDEPSPANGQTYRVQYFERARFELHREQTDPRYRVLLGLLGTEQYRAQYATAPPAEMGGDPQGPNCVVFPETGKQVCGPFLAYWRANGGLAQQGLPLTDVFLETNPTNRQPYLTQYFERARFELHPQPAGAQIQVLLGLLGREQFLAKYQGGSSAPASSPDLQSGAQISISPPQGPNSTRFIVTGIRFAPYTTYHVQVRNRTTGAPIPLDDARVQSQRYGDLAKAISFAEDVPAGAYTASIASAASGGIVYASTNFSLTGIAGTQPAPNIVVTPPQGEVGSNFLITGTGFAPGVTYTLRVQTADRQTTIQFTSNDITADAEGVLLTKFGLSDAYPAGVYSAEILGKGGEPQLVAGAQFTVTAPIPSPGPGPSPAPRGFNPHTYTGQGDQYNCDDCAAQAQARAVLRAAPRAPGRLDTNKEGIACASTPAPNDLTPVPHSGLPVRGMSLSPPRATRAEEAYQQRVTLAVL